MKRFEFVEVSKPEGEYLTTAAFMDCMTCGRTIDTNGGPGQYVCGDCVEFIKTGKAKGCIVIEESPPTVE